MPTARGVDERDRVGNMMRENGGGVACTSQGPPTVPHLVEREEAEVAAAERHGLARRHRGEGGAVQAWRSGRRVRRSIASLAAPHDGCEGRGRECTRARPALKDGGEGVASEGGMGCTGGQ